MSNNSCEKLEREMWVREWYSAILHNSDSECLSFVFDINGKD